MKQKEQNAIAKKFNIREKDLKTYISNLAIVRNLCAHDEKLFDIRIRRAISNTDIHKKYNLKMKDGTYCKGFKDLFSIVIILKLLLNDKEFNKFCKILIEDIEELKCNIFSLDFNSVLDVMGFPYNYKNLIESDKIENESIRIHHICIQTNCYHDSKIFYTTVLGFKLLQETKDFHGRDYNTWLELNGFMIELQTGKKDLEKYNKEAEGIAHFALYIDNLEKFVAEIKDRNNVKFKKKDGNIIYNVENSKLIKIIAPEGTIIEIRDSKSI